MISDNLISLRKLNRMSQEEVAEKIGVSRQAVAKWESGATTPDINNCIELATLYSVSIDDLVNYSGKTNPNLIPPKGKHIFGVVSLGEKGQIIIPKKAREIFNLAPGDKIVILGDEEFAFCLAVILIFVNYGSIKIASDSEIEEVVTVDTVSTILPTTTYKPVKFVAVSKTIEEPVVEEEQVLQEDIELIALVMAEAEGECEEGKRLVIDTILNRVDSEYFPDTIYDVVYQSNQFSSMWNGRVDRCEVREEICQLVREELKSRTNYDVIFFTAGRYNNYGEPMFQVENHYFSCYD